jgi:hypothetical protein
MLLMRVFSIENQRLLTKPVPRELGARRFANNINTAGRFRPDHGGAIAGHVDTLTAKEVSTGIFVRTVLAIAAVVSIAQAMASNPAAGFDFSMKIDGSSFSVGEEARLLISRWAMSAAQLSADNQ